MRTSVGLTMAAGQVQVGAGRRWDRSHLDLLRGVRPHVMVVRPNGSSPLAVWTDNASWAYDPAPTGEDLFETGAGVNVGYYSNPVNDANIERTHTAPTAAAANHGLTYLREPPGQAAAGCVAAQWPITIDHVQERPEGLCSSGDFRRDITAVLLFEPLASRIGVGRLVQAHGMVWTRRSAPEFAVPCGKGPEQELPEHRGPRFISEALERTVDLAGL
jgi:hypothetical protein